MKSVGGGAEDRAAARRALPEVSGGSRPDAERADVEGTNLAGDPSAGADRHDPAAFLDSDPAGIEQRGRVPAAEETAPAPADLA